MSIRRIWRHTLPAVVLLLLACASGLGAQTVHGTLMEDGTRTAVDAARVVLLDEAGMTVAGSLTDRDGSFRIEAPGPGRYRVSAERIGYASRASEPFELTAGQILEVTLFTPPDAVRLDAVVASGGSRCELRPQEGLAVHALWEEARKALAATAWGEREDLFRFRYVRYVRELDPRTLQVRAEQSRSRNEYGSRPFRSLSAEELLLDGFVTSVGDSIVYNVPDAHVLLSDAFLDSHCFRVHPGERGNADRLGLAFEPVQSSPGVGLSGVLWLDVESAELRSLEYRYVGRSLPRPARDAYGEAHLRRLPSGAWIVERWFVRAPLVTVRMERVAGQEVMRESVAGLFEEGGEVLEIVDFAGSRVAGNRAASIVGVVYDSIAGAPLAGARVYLSGTSHSARTDEEGRFELHGLGSGSFVVGVDHERLAVLGIYPPGREVRVDGGRGSTIELAVPSAASLRSAVCTPTDHSPGEGVVVGRVVDPRAGSPVEGADVLMTWVGEATGERATARMRTVGNGIFRICGVPSSRSVVLEARLDGRLVGRTAFEMIDGAVVEHDLLTGEVGSTRLSGRIVDAATGEPIPAARVRLADGGIAALSDRWGNFVLADVPAGERVIEVEHIGYGALSEAVRLDGEAVQVEVLLDPRPIAIAGITVEVVSEARRVENSSGVRRDFLDRDAIESRSRTARHVGDLIRGSIPNVTVRDGFGAICIESVRGLPMDPQDRQPCEMVTVFVDGVQIFEPQGYLTSLSPPSIESVEFIGPLLARSRYGAAGARGVLLITTRTISPRN